MPSTRRWSVSHQRVVVSVALATLGTFVVSGGIGMSSWLVGGVGMALLAVGVGVFALSAISSRAYSFIAGTAHVVSASEPPASASRGRCHLHIVVHAKTIAGLAVKIRDDSVPVAKWPDAGSTLPILVAVDDPRRVRVLWDEIPTHAEAAARKAQRDGAEYEQVEFAFFDPGTDDADGYTDPTLEVVDDELAETGPSGQVIEMDLRNVRWSDTPSTGTDEQSWPPTDDASRPSAVKAGAPAPDPVGATAAADTASRSHGTASHDETPADTVAAGMTPPAQRDGEAFAAGPATSRPAEGRSPWMRPPETGGPRDAGPARDRTGADTPAAAGPPGGSGAPGTGGSAGDPPGGPAGTGDASQAGPGGVARRRPSPRPRRPADDEPDGPVASGAATAPAPAPDEPVIVGISFEKAWDIPSTYPAMPAPQVQLFEQPVTATPDLNPDSAYDQALEEDPTVTAAYLATAPPPGSPRTGRIQNIAVTLFVTDLDRSIAFYRDMLGLTNIDHGPNGVVLDTGGGRIELRRVKMAPVDRRVVHLLLEVPDVEAAYRELVGRGVSFIHRPRQVGQYEQMTLWSAALRDPDGHGIAITQWRPSR